MRNVFDRLHSEGSASASRSVPLLQSLDRCGDDIGDLGSRYVRLPHPRRATRDETVIDNLKWLIAELKKAFTGSKEYLSGELQAKGFY